MDKLTAPEEELMLAVWRAQEGALKDFIQLMEAPAPPYTTVASTMRNLERKGYVKYRTFGNVHVYSPAVPEEEYKKKFMGNVIRDYFGNSYKELVNFFISHKKLSVRELKEVVKMIEGDKAK